RVRRRPGLGHGDLEADASPSELEAEGEAEASRRATRNPSDPPLLIDRNGTAAPPQLVCWGGAAGFFLLSARLRARGLEGRGEREQVRRELLDRRQQVGVQPAHHVRVELLADVRRRELPLEHDEVVVRDAVVALELGAALLPLLDEEGRLHGVELLDTLLE